MSIRLGVVGYGSRGRFMASQMYQRHEDFVLAAVADQNTDMVPAALKEQGLDPDKVQVFADLDSMLAADACDCVIVATNCSSHTDLAIKVLEKGLPLYLEKPVCTNMEDYYRLKEAGEKHPDVPVVVSFPLRVSQLCLDAKQIIESGQLGRVEQVQGYNNVPYGGVYYHSWYRNYDVAGGLFLQKATHDLDYIQYVLGGMRPVELCAMKSKQVFNGNKPTGLMCSQCDERETCRESAVVLKRNGQEVFGEYCCYGEDSKNEDSGSVLIRYDTGMHVAYTQNFFIKRSAQKRGARFLGEKGTLEFDWYTNTMTVYQHDIDRVDTYRYNPSMDSHFGGDNRLVDSFYQLITGQTKQSVASLREGLDSAYLCLKATQSAEEHRFVTLDDG